MTPIEMKERIEALEAAITPLNEERIRLKQELIETTATFKVGQMISWNDGARKGRVNRIFSWCYEPAYKVSRLRNNGTFGAEVDVHSYNKPVLI